MKKFVFIISLVLVLTASLSIIALAAPDVSGAIESTWNATKDQIKSIVDKVVFPVLSTILAIFFFVKLAGAYFDYRKHGQFEWVAPVVLFACLLFSLTASQFLWTMLGM